MLGSAIQPHFTMRNPSLAECAPATQNYRPKCLRTAPTIEESIALTWVEIFWYRKDGDVLSTGRADGSYDKPGL